MTTALSPRFRGSLRLPCSSDAQHEGKPKNIIHKIEKSFRYRDAQHGGKQKNIIRKFEQTFCCRDAQHNEFEKTFCSKDAQHTGKQKDMIRKFEQSEVIRMRVWLSCCREAPACLEAR